MDGVRRHIRLLGARRPSRWSSAGGVMVSRNLLHAVLFLILTFVGVAGFFVLLSADFIAMAQVIIYVGAIAVLVLFAVLLTPRAGRDNGETR